MPQSASPEDSPSEEVSASLSDATARLEAALGRLEALVETGPLQSELFRESATGADASRSQALQADLAEAHEREQALEAAAASASQALGHAMTEVRRVLAETPPNDGLGDALDDAGDDDGLDPLPPVEDGKA